MGMGGGHVPMIEDFKFPEKQELKLKLKDMLEDEVDEKYYLSTDKIEKISHWKAYQKPFEKVQGNNSVVPTLTARGAGEEHSGMITYCDSLEDTTNLQEECLNIKSGAYARDFGSKGKIQDKDYCDTLTASMGTGGGNVPILRIKNATKKGYLEAQEGDGIDISSRMQYHRGNVQKGTVQTLDCTGGEGHGVVTNDLRIRKLTPKECWRLMGFDDSDYEKASKVNSNTQLYKQAGNSIAVNVLMAIFNNLHIKKN
jgi:DNA (cytosine-5)-methyltransferase 1